MANWIRTQRGQIRISQEELASRLQVRGFDVSRGTISHWEIGRYHPPLDDPEFTNVLADALEMSVLRVLAEAGYKFTADLSDYAKQAADMIERMPPNRQKTALSILEQLLHEG